MHWQHILVFFILCLAADLRLYKISEYMTFLGDEGRDVMVVKQIIVDHKFTLLGPTSSVGGFFLGPIYYYFMAPFLWAWKLDPTGPAVMVAIFGIATVYLVYFVGKQLFHPIVGLVASALYALSPLVIAYSRSSWNPNVVPFFAILTMYFAYTSIEKKRSVDFFLVGLTVGIGLQLHYVYLFLIATVCIWFLIVGREKSYLNGYGLVLFGFICGFAPYLLFEFRHGFPNTLTIIRFIFTSEDTKFSISSFFKTIDDVSFRLFGRLLFRYPQPEILPDIPTWNLAFWNAAISTIRLLSISLLLFIFLNRKYVSSSIWRACMLILLWFSFPIVLFGLYRKGIYDYYFGIFYAVPFLLFGLICWILLNSGINSIKNKHLTILHIIPILCFVLIFIFSLYINWQGRPFLYPPNNQLSSTRNIAKVVFDEANGKPFNFALLAVGNSDHAYRYFFDIWGNSPIVIENQQKDPDRKTVTNQLVVLCDMPPDQCKPLGHPLWEIAGFGSAEIAKTTKASYMTVMKLVHYNTN
jgi:4-amino-4-deoxy-L-arabinose transferase-like glycosyltransferase